MSESERVEKEFKQWQERYEISLEQEFQVKTLLKLQEEYDSVGVGSNTTRTRETLLKMINETAMKIKLIEKRKAKVEENNFEKLQRLCDENIEFVLKNHFSSYDCRFFGSGDSASFYCNDNFSYTVFTKERMIKLNPNILHFVNSKHIINDYLCSILIENINNYIKEYFKSIINGISDKEIEEIYMLKNIKIVYDNVPFITVNDDLEPELVFNLGIDEYENIINKCK